MMEIPPSMAWKREEWGKNPCFGFGTNLEGLSRFKREVANRWTLILTAKKFVGI